ncbi:DNA recombination protein RmuC [Agromyces archimandritae]|uniref:DNA recombination protein RmuC n=1 Tax=Agromyces archimandritae TaxID=2781962 RepID=A0A975INF5_9MICO|nr:DNA recombination protein RmuC [Agromyces archimandritae]QTX04189.1 DNA recombination protein RmuC [Agromyces archimandritae]
MDLLSLFIGIVIGGVIGALALRLVLGRRSDGAPAEAGEDPALVEARHQAQIAEIRAVEAAAQAELRAQEHEVRARLQAELASTLARVEGLEEQIGAARTQYRELVEQQRSDQAERAEREKRESAVLQALSPVRETLQTMQTKVTELERQRSEQYGSLAEQLKQAQVSDEQLRTTTESLASALRSNSTRGVWGETQLRRVVEAAGLTNQVDFTMQHSISTDAGNGRPDMVVRLPGSKAIPVDAKVPLEAYIEASQIPVTATGEEGARRKQLIDKHVKAVRAHIDALAKKTYWEGLDSSPEFVIAFIPSESLLSSALEADPALLDYAFGKRVALASPVNLWAVLKTVAFAWQQQAVSDEAKKLFDLGNTLYQRIGTLAGHADGLRKAIARTVDSYNKFANSLESRVLVTARQFPGIDATKIELLAEPEVIHEQPRPLTAPEVTESLVQGAESSDPAPQLLLDAVEMPDAEAPGVEAPEAEQGADRGHTSDAGARSELDEPSLLDLDPEIRSKIAD